MKETDIYAGDFETTVYEGQKDTRVWSSAIAHLYSDETAWFSDIPDTLQFFKRKKCNAIVYYHNLKFDGAFWVDWLLNNGFTLAVSSDGVPKEKREMLNNTFITNISSMGQWYSVIIRTAGIFIELRDSLKLLPFSLKEVGKAFHTEHQKLEMDYVGDKKINYRPTKEEMDYIINDVLVLKEALEICFDRGHTKLTIGSCCLSEFKKLWCGRYGDTDIEYKATFPNLADIKIDSEIYGSETADEYIRKSYKGAWCYVKEGCENKIVNNGCTLDVNSLYPSMMHSTSGNVYPIGQPHFFKGNVPNFSPNACRFWFIRIKCRFRLKDGYLPFIQVKNDVRYRPNKMLTSSNVIRKGVEYEEYSILGYKQGKSYVTLTLTMMDYELLHKHYDVYEEEILDGCWFQGEVGTFDCYIDKYKEIKMKSKGAERTLAKLFLNHLYGKLATNPTNRIKLPSLEGNVVRFDTVDLEPKKPVYIPCGSAITSYARCFTISAAQANYDTFVYADTDSIHCLSTPVDLKGVKIHPTEFCCWKCESEWDEAIFVRQKTYVEHLTKDEDGNVVDEYNIKCAGMPEKSKQLFEDSIRQRKREGVEYNDWELNFINRKRTLKDFTYGLTISGKLLPKRIKGGIILIDTFFEMRKEKEL